jgi:peptidoglycan pentaglycine glycine transferase (the first glycine)
VTDLVTTIEDFPDRERWNEFVLSSPFGHFFQSWDWGTLQEAFDVGGKPRRIAAVSAGQIVGCIQILIFDTGHRQFAYAPRGPVADPADWPLVKRLVEDALVLSATAGVEFLRIEPQWAFDTDLALQFVDLGFFQARQRIMPLRTMLVDLRPPIDDIWNSFRPNARNRIRLAEKRGVRVRVGSEEDVASFVRLFEETGSRHGIRLGRIEPLVLAGPIFGPLGTMRMYLASGDDEDLAGIMLFLGGTMATYLWGGSAASEKARWFNPNQLLHWTAMQWARERGCTTYDLFGIPDYDEDVLEAEYDKQSGGLWNLYRFKRGFRGVVHRHLGTFDRVFRVREPAGGEK